MSDAPAAPAADGAAVDRVALDASWKARVGHWFEREDMRALSDFLRAEKHAGKTIYPPGPRLFAALDTTPFDAVKVVILGQDPYHGPDQAHGLCFSVLPGVPVPPSLDNIFKEIERDLGACRTYGIESENVPARGQMFDDSPADSGSIGQEAADIWTAQADLQPVLHKSGRLPGIARPDHGCLLPWARQGVLLLNAVLTVERGRAGSHQGKGWEGFTDACVEALNREREDLVFLLWGSYAQAKGKLIDSRRHRVLKAPHPSPLSAHRGFLGCGHFSRTNEYLVQRGFAPIDWRLPPRAGLVVD